MTQPVAPFNIVDGDPAAGIVILCDHASNYLPPEYGTLGIDRNEFERHIAYDIGAADLARGLSERLNAPAVLSHFSRLLIDPNRGEDDPTIVMRLSDGTIVPGNHPISEKEIQHRIDHFHAPYHDAVDDVIEQSIATGNNPIIFSIHSFTPLWKNIPRPWHAAMLWDADPRLPKFMIDKLRALPDMIIGDNEPYDGALKNDTMYRHATRRGLVQGLLEVRQDLIDDAAGVRDWVNHLAPMLEEANQRADMHETVHFGSRSDGTARKDGNDGSN